MERDRDFRRASASAINGLPRSRQRVTTLRDSTDQDRPMELQETVRLGDREQLQKKGRDREFLKRRRVDRSAVQERSDGAECCRGNEDTESSDEEYYDDEEDTRIHRQNRTNQLSPTSSSLSNNRRGLRTRRSSPVLRAAAEEMLGVPIPRKVRSSKRLQEHWNSGSGFDEDLRHRRFSPSQATVSLIGPGGASQSSSKKMKSRVFSSASNPKPSMIQDDEIEVAEALFDLMKQSQSQSRRQEKVDRDRINTCSDELKMSKTDGDKDENNAALFSVGNEKVNAETILGDSMKELKKEGRMIRKEKFPDVPAEEELVSTGDGFVNKVKVGPPPKEIESPSCVKVNACDIEDPTVIKAHYEAIIIEDKKEAKLEIDLMAPPPLPSSADRDASDNVGTDPEVMCQVVQKKSESISKDGGPLAVAKQEKIGVTYHNHTQKHRHDDISSVSTNTTEQQQGRKEQTNQQSPTSLLPFPIAMSSWPGVLPHPGYMLPLQAVLPINGSDKSSMVMQPPQFKFSQPRPKRCATHQYLAQNIHHHQELIDQSLSSGSSGGAAALYGSKSSNPKCMLSTQTFIPGNPLLGDFQGGQNFATISVGSGKDKRSDAAVSFNATTSGKSVLQQASNPASAANFLDGPGFIFPLGHHKKTVMAPANSSGPPHSASAVGNASLPSNSAGRLSVNLPFPAASAAVSSNHPMFPSDEAAPYVAMLQNNYCPIPISTNIAIPPFRGSPSVPFFNPSFYPLPVSSATQNHHLTLPHAPAQSASQHTSTVRGSSSHKQPHCQQQTSDSKFPTSVTANSSQSDKLLQPAHLSSKYEKEISWKSGASVAHGLVSHSVKHSNAQNSSFPSQPMNLAMIPPMSIGGGAVGNKHIDPPQHGSKGRVEVIPQAFALSFGSNASLTHALNFSSMAQNSAMFQMLPNMFRNGNQMVHQKNFQASEGKYLTAGGQAPKSDGTEVSAVSTTGPSKFDGLPGTINFLPSSLTGNQTFQTSPAALSSRVSVTVPNFQHHQQLVQVQNNNDVHQMQLAGTAQGKSSSPNSTPGCFFTGMFPSNNPVFKQVAVPNDNSSFPTKWEKFRSTTSPEGSSQSATSSLGNISQLKSSQGQTHITFGNSTISAASFQGHQIVTKNEPVALIVGSPSNSSISRNTGGSSQRSASAVGIIPSLPPSQEEAEASPDRGTGQKSSPACRRNVPSILSTCPSPLPELKY